MITLGLSVALKETRSLKVAKYYPGRTGGFAISSIWLYEHRYGDLEKTSEGTYLLLATEQAVFGALDRNT